MAQCRFKHELQLLFVHPNAAGEDVWCQLRRLKMTEEAVS